jgi:ATP-dependent Lon protease
MKKRSEQQPKQSSSKISIDTHHKSMLEINSLICEKAVQLNQIIRNTVLSMNINRKYDIFSNSESILCIGSLSELHEKCSEITTTVKSLPQVNVADFAINADTTPIVEINTHISKLQQVVDKLSVLISGFGTRNLSDLLYISLGTTEVEVEPRLKDKLDLLLQYAHPISYKTIYWKHKNRSAQTMDTVCCDKLGEDCPSAEMANQLECFDTESSMKTPYVNVHGGRIVIHSDKMQKTIVVQCVFDDIPVECVSSEYILSRKTSIQSKMPEPQNTIFDHEIMRRVIESCTLKDYLVYSDTDLLKRQFSVMTEVNGVKVHKLDYTIKKFIDMDVCDQRQMLIHLLLYNKDEEIQYITYLLYDLTTGSSQSDSPEQMFIYDSFPWKVKMYFKDTMKNTLKFTKDMINKYDINRITLEQQIYVMKVSEQVKEKAVAKLKEIKGKSDDSGSKAKQYLEGLLKIPFGVFREEPILLKPKQISNGFIQIIDKLCPLIPCDDKTGLDKYSMVEISRITDKMMSYIRDNAVSDIVRMINGLSVKNLSAAVSIINGLRVSGKIPAKSLVSREDKIAYITSFVLEEKAPENLSAVYDCIAKPSANTFSLSRSLVEIEKLKEKIVDVRESLTNITDILDESIHGHEHAKTQILKIIGQWMSGEQTGYCFGFEGSPGVGKTSLAKKGLASCLRDADGNTRPFAFIALGGSCNGSTLEGHSYTYVNSLWGRITDILMDTKCMNPIIYIDELDKVSKTEHGKEIIGILMHLIDTTQNDVFQDKYFSGIDLDLSKALFIFSYNDPAQIDRILLDRIHRIKFENLSIDEKLVIVRKYILPEINRKMGFNRSSSTESESMVNITDDLVEYLICTYTFESGVRKLKEVLFDLFGEINIDLLRGDALSSVSIPYHITQEDIDQKYLKKYDKFSEKTVHSSPRIGIINGLWASAYGKGGIIPVQTMFFPSATFLDLKLTGSQGDVMKESMTVAKTIAWGLLTEEERASAIVEFDKTKTQGLHIHCPDGATPKDGPSAGGAITVCIYSLLTHRPISNTVAMTGEITLQGDITEIGGLEDKFLGGIRAGVKKFIYPERNTREFKKFWDKYGSKKVVEGIQFVAVSRIEEAIKETAASHT